MSLGWQTESALLPSKVKPIHVDSNSLFSLKAVIYETEQRQKLNNATKERKQLFRSKNKINSQNTSLPSEETGTDSNVSKAELALIAKSKIYDQILDGIVEGDSTVVDFNLKRRRVAEDSTPSSAVQCVTATVDTTITAEYGNQQWQWSRGNQNNEEVVTQWRKEEQSAKMLQEKIQQEVDDCRITTSKPNISTAAKIKTQWEKTLNSTARGFLDKVHEETAASRGAAVVNSQITDNNSQTKSLREDRLEFIKRKRQQIRY